MQETPIEEKIKRENHNKGITLIALVVTIIVLLILAGVSITTLTGDNGIITRATGAKKAVENGSVREQVQLAVMAGMSNRDLSVDEEKLEEALGNSFGEKGTGYTIQVNKTEGLTITIPQNKSSYFINSDGDFEEIDYEEPIDNSKSLVEGFVDDLGTRATIYLYGNSQKQVSESITTTVTGRPDGSIVENYKNQPKIVTPSYTTELTAEANYVAYTVNKNGTYTFSVTDGTTTTETKIKVRNIENFTLIDSIASKSDELKDSSGNVKAYRYKGAAVPKGYFVDTNSDVSTGLVITDSIIKVNTNDTTGYSNGNEWVWVPVNSTVGNHEFYDTDDTEETGKMAGIDSGTKELKYSKYSLLYDFTTNASTKETTRTAKAKTKPSAASGCREIAILTSTTYGEKANLGRYPIYSRATAKNTKPTALASEEAIASQYIADYKNMVTSVSTYNGFYIGRYEITANGEQPGTSLAGTISGTAWNWFALYNKCMTLNMENTETSMMYGSLWDATMQWLSSSYNVGYTGNTYSDYGNYKTEAVKVSNNTTTITVKAKGTGAKLSTGQTSYTKSNNIYDLSGNCYDGTQEAYDSNFRVLRGGSCNDYGSNGTYSAYRDGDDPTTSDGNYSSHPQLYIK